MMYRGRQRGSRPSRGGPHGNTISKAPLKGLFSDGNWKCNCDPRLTAQHFQTKNGGKNHGRWFYTCQQPQHKRCDFFLWDDDAKSREESAVLHNSRTESPLPPVTPRKAKDAPGLPTPQTSEQISNHSSFTSGPPDTPSKSFRVANHPISLVKVNERESQATTATISSDEEFYDWPNSDEEALKEATDQASLGSFTPSKRHYPDLPSPTKSVKVDVLSSPSKRHRESDIPKAHPTSNDSWKTPSKIPQQDEDVFTSPSEFNSAGKNLFGPQYHDSPSKRPVLAPTPSFHRYKEDLPGKESELANEVLETLKEALSAPLYLEARESIKDVCHRHVMFTKSLIKGRDVLRDVVKKRDERVVELQSEIEQLRIHRETDRSVIMTLRRDMSKG